LYNIINKLLKYYISPQRPQFNRVYWRELERYVRALPEEKYPAIHVFTGSLYLPYEEADGKKYVKYEVIGESNISVPTHFFKVILDEKGEFVEAYILPNDDNIAITTPLDTFKASMEKVERVSGIIFSSMKNAL
jgi:endonuclease G, mitochondrial